MLKKNSKQKTIRKSYPSPFSLEKGDFTDKELKKRLKETLTRESDLTPRLIAFIKIFGHPMIRKQMFYTSTSRSQAMQMIPNSLMMTS